MLKEGRSGLSMGLNGRSIYTVSVVIATGEKSSRESSSSALDYFACARNDGERTVEASPRHCEERLRRSNPVFLAAQDCFAYARNDAERLLPIDAACAVTMKHFGRSPPPTGASFMSIEFLVTSLIVIASPGTGVLYTLAAGLSRGPRASVVAAFGCTMGIVPHMAAAILGLAALLHASALAFQAFKLLGVAYLLYMAWNTLRERGALQVAQQIDGRSAIRVTVTAVLINILNPKLSIFFLAFLPQFVSAAEPDPLWRMLALSGTFMLMTFVVFVGYGLFAASVRDHVISRPRVLTWMRRSFAGAFVALGAKLAFADQ
jgi:threonine/homoserine/homoserine lactone efflux protein